MTEEYNIYAATGDIYHFHHYTLRFILYIFISIEIYDKLLTY